MKRDTRRPQVIKTRAVTVYQPGVPLRAVAVYRDVVDGKPAFEREELFVVGVEAVVRDHYIHGPVSQRDPDPVPRSMRECDITEAGYYLQSAHGIIDHRVLVWQDEYQCPTTVDEWEADNTKVVVGPREQTEAWWDQQLKAAEKELTERARRDSPPTFADPPA